VTAAAIATPHGVATAAGERAFAAGGNAIDAALAAAAALTVVYPHNCALGGDLFALVREPDGRTTSINASGPAGSATDAAALRAMPITGPETITVPGLVAGWDALHRRGAASSWADAIEPAVALARDGVPVAPGLAAAIAEAADAGALADPGMASVFAPAGTPLTAGEALAQPALADTLRELAQRGAGSFYRGAIAEQLLAGLGAVGSRLRAPDLAGFAPEETAPARTAFGDVEVLTSPPSSSGVLLLQALAALESAAPADPLGSDAALLARIFHAGARERDRLLGDPRDSDVTLGDWLGPEALAAALAGTGHAPAAEARPTGDTVAVVAVDAEGRAVSLIQSLFNSFGSRILEPRTGVLLHNRGAMFSLEPGHPNALAPGRRPAHTLMPVLVERDGGLLGVLGTMGGKVHAQIHVQVLLRLLSGQPAQDAVDAPRWIVGGMEVGEPDDTIRIEDGCAEATRQALGAAGLRLIDVPRRSDWLGHAQAIWLDGGGSVGTDFRADP
jgi:gamma-glutamyltranspeptidase/glutathione hydrolase